MLRFLSLGIDIRMSAELLDVTIINPRRLQPCLFLLCAMAPVIIITEFAFSLEPVLQVAGVRTSLAFPYLIGPISQLLDLVVFHYYLRDVIDDLSLLESRHHRI